MLAESSIGLSPTCDRIIGSMQEQGFDIVGLPQRLDAIEYIKLARPSVLGSVHEPATFTFSHRRFQEYFATCVVLRELHRISFSRLLSDGRWRETAVVLCQTRPIGELGVFLAEAERELQRMCNELSPTCIWPRNTLHLLGLLQDGFAPRLHSLPTTISEHIDCLVMYASKSPSGIDRKWAVEVAGCATQSTLIALLREAISSGSDWLGGVAYKQASHLRAVPADVAHWIRQSLLDSARTGRLLRERYSTAAFLKRLPQPHDFISVAQLLLWAPAVDLALLATIWICMSSRDISHPLRALWLLFVPVVVFPFATLWCPIDKMLAFLSGRGTGTLQVLNLPVIMVIIMVRSVAFFSLFYGSSVVSDAIKRWIPLQRNMSNSGYVWSVQRLHVSIHPLLASLSIYSLLWGMTAVWSAAYGDFTELSWWPLQPLRPVMHFTTNTKARINDLVVFLRSVQVRLALGIVMSVGACLFILPRILQKYEKFLTPVFMGLVTLVVVTFITFVLRNWALIIKWRNRIDRAMTVRALWSTLRDYSLMGRELA